MFSNFFHQSLVKVQIVNRKQDWPEHFAYIEKMADSPATEIFATVAVAAFLNGGGIVDMGVISHL